MSNDFEINEQDLASEWLAQPRLFKKYADALADARLAVDKAEAKLKVVRADLDYDIRSNPAEFNLTKATEAIVENTIVKQSKHKAASKALVEAKHAMRVLDGAVQTMEHRKRALEKLVDLHGQHYWAAPKASKEGMSAAERKIATRKFNRRKNKGDE